MEIQNIQSSQKEIPIGEEGKGKTGTGSIGAKLGGVLTDRDRLACHIWTLPPCKGFSHERLRPG